jgi:signal transduction histidine kinase/CheY-like chemotaxis protein
VQLLLRTAWLRPESRIDAGLDELRFGVIRRAAVLAIIVSLLLLAYSSIKSDAWTPFWFALTIGPLGLFSLALSRDHQKCSALLLVIGLSLTTVAAAETYPSSLVLVLFAFLITLAAITLGWFWAIGISIFATATTLGTFSPIGRLPVDLVIIQLAAIWSGAALSWLVLGPLHTALNWSWSSYVQAREKTEEARDRQQELTQALKSLDIAYYNLSAANAALAEARREADEARRTKTEFANTLSHELRTPLNLIIGFSEMMVIAPQRYYDETLPEVYRDDVEAIYRNSSHILSLVDDVLDLAQVEAHRMPLRRECVPVDQIVEQSVACVRGLLRDKGLDLTVSLPPSLPNVWVDPVRVRQVIVNLVSNAARYTDAGRIGIAAAAPDGEVVVSISDTGLGMRPEELTRAFEEFRQVGTFERRHGGSGLGLAICKSFVEMQGGSIWAESKLGTGSTFHFSLPITSNVVAVPLQRRLDRLISPESSESPDRVVGVIDADASTLRIFQRYLDGYRIVSARDGTRPEHSGARGRPCALIASGPIKRDEPLKLPDGVGPATPVVFCPLTTSQRRIFDLGATEYLSKPFTGHLFQSVLRRVAPHARRVLVVDDDPEMVRLVMRMVNARRPHRQVVQAYNGADALSLIANEPPDLILLDLLMPVVDGYEVLARLRASEATRDLPVVVMSARGRDESPIVTEMIGVTRAAGLNVGEALGCVRSLLDSLLEAPVADASPASPPDRAR